MHHPVVSQAIRLARTPLEAARWLVRNALDHPHTVSHRDASAAALWPFVPEEAVPPRWPIVPPEDAHASGGRHTRNRRSPVMVRLPAPCGTTQVSPLWTDALPSWKRSSPAPDSMTSTANPGGSS